MWDELINEYERSLRFKKMIDECFKDEFPDDRQMKLLRRLLYNTSPRGVDCRGCLIWNGAYNPSGYGIVSKSKYGWRGAHAAAHYLFRYKGPVGPLPGVYILHSCNNKGCINPYHLREGTAKDNADDYRKYRQKMSGHTFSNEKVIP